MTFEPDADFIALQRAFAGEYSLDHEIGRGGMGIVYLAREVTLARPVAIKVLPPSQSTPDLRAQFLREAQIVARLSHPNIVPVHAVGEREGYAFIAMAYVEGITLGERIRTRGPLLPGQAARLLREVAWALAYAHAGGIVHRDVSAENIVLERGTDRAIVMDFGIASAIFTTAVSRDGRIVGNPYYVSPEHATGEPIDHRSDLYSLGVCGYYALTGELPFTGSTPLDIVAAHIAQSPKPITIVAPGVPARLAHAVDRCLAKEPWRRYRSAESLAEAIDQAFEHAREIPAPLRVWIRRSEGEYAARVIALGASTLFGIVLAARTLSPWMFFVPIASVGVLSILPAIQRLRRVVAAGYWSGDIAAALREHQLVRDEELAYEATQQPPWKKQLLWGALAAAVFGGIAAGQSLARLSSPITTERMAYVDALLAGIMASLAVGTVAAVGIGSEMIRQKLTSRVASFWTNFWKGKWGSRWTQLVTFGVKRPAHPALGLPMLTEIALGRATDHLFQSLPKAVRKELAALPEVVRRLEGDAAGIRERIAEIDSQLSAFEFSNADDKVRAYRDAVRDSLLESRSQATSRLTAAVAALESIRLDLLQLQMGHADVASVTASLEAAQRLGQDIALAVHARNEVESLLAEPGESILERTAQDDDADTPVGGVTAASV